MIELIIALWPWVATKAAEVIKALGWRGVLALLALGAIVFAHVWAVDRAREEGEATVRAEWVKANQEVDSLAEEKRQAQQTKINAAEGEMVQLRLALASRQSDLMAALAEERKSNVDAKAKAKARGRCTVRSDMSERVRGTLNAIR